MIRKALETDIEAVKRCARAAYAIYVERIGREPAPMVADFETLQRSGDLYVDDRGNREIGGFVVFYPRDDHLHLENVAVHPDFQGRGIGRSLIEFAERAALKLGLDRIVLYTNAKMSENLELYPRLGYRRFDRRVEDGFDRVYFDKRPA